MQSTSVTSMSRQGGGLACGTIMDILITIPWVCAMTPTGHIMPVTFLRHTMVMDHITESGTARTTEGAGMAPGITGNAGYLSLEEFFYLLQRQFYAFKAGCITGPDETFAAVAKCSAGNDSDFLFV